MFSINMFSKCLAFSPLLASLAAAQQTVLKAPTNPLDARFKALVNKTLDFWNVPGLALAVVDGDDVWAEGYGIAEFPDTPVTPSTLFMGGSTTKAFVAAAMSMLVDDNDKYPEVQWKTPVSSLIREDFVLEDEYATSHVSIEDILSHRTGMPRHDLAYGGTHNGRPHKPKDLVRSLRYLPLTAELRTKYQYCNTMFVAASYLIETLTGVGVGDFLREKIWEPLGMRATFFTLEDAIKAPEFFAQGYVYVDGSYQPVPPMNLDVISGAGSIISNVLDYTKWIKAMINSSGPISAAGHTAVTSARTLTNEDSEPFTGTETYALGWVKGVYCGQEFVTHSGGMDAFVTNVIFFPRLKYGLVTFANTAYKAGSAEQKLLYHLIDEKLGIPESERFNFTKQELYRLQKTKENYDNATNIFYPKVPHHPLPLSLPLQNYTGTYTHPGYNEVTIEIRDDVLYADRSNTAWKIYFKLEHISGEYFVARVNSLTAPGPVFKVAFPAEFLVGSDGVVQKLGIGIEPEMGEERIWFDRV